MFFKTLVTLLPKGLRRPLYGDHTIVHPDFKALDMRKVKAAGKIVYTTPETWATRKGGAFRDIPARCTPTARGSLRNRLFVPRREFLLREKYIADCAVMAESPSNLSRWKDVTINHHITTVADDLATLFGTP